MMNINCIICSDIFLPSSEIYVTRCGHVFHHVCLVQWIERSKTCPQCRTKTTEKLINRLYFNIPSTEGIVDDVPTLQGKLDASKLELRMKDKTLKDAQELISQSEEKIQTLQDCNDSLSISVTQKQSAIIALKEQVLYYKDKAVHVEKVEAEIKNVKGQMRCLQDTTRAITGTMEDVQSIVRECHDIHTLSSIVTALKKEIVNLEKKKNAYFRQLKLTENENNQQKKEIAELKKENEQLRVDLQTYKLYAAENEMLKEKLAEKVEGTAISQTSKKRQFESPAPLLIRPNAKQFSDDASYVEIDSPNVSWRIREIKKSSSPYLKIKSNNLGQLLRQEDVTKFSRDNDKSIFKNITKRDVSTKAAPEGTYNGFGGHSKDDVYPQPSNAVKRKTSTMTSSKLKKLAKPNKKISEFLDILSDV